MLFFSKKNQPKEKNSVLGNFFAFQFEVQIVDIQPSQMVHDDEH